MSDLTDPKKVQFTPEQIGALLDHHMLGDDEYEVDYVRSLGVGIDTRATSRMDDLGFVLEDGVGVLCQTTKGDWIGVASPANIDDPDAWQACFEAARGRVNTKADQARLREALFVHESELADAMGWRDDSDLSDRFTLDDATGIVIVTADAGPYYSTRHIPRAWLAHHGIERPIVTPEDIAAKVGGEHMSLAHGSNDATRPAPGKVGVTPEPVAEADEKYVPPDALTYDDLMALIEPD